MALKKPSGTVSQSFGANPDYYKQFGQKGHNGIDYAVTYVPVYASEAGKIYFEGYGQNNAWMGSVAGICVLIDHGTIYTGYAHLERTIVNKGQTVTKGQLIGYSGASGQATGPHLHFEVLKKPVNINNGYYGRVNPNPYFVEERKLVNKSDLSAIYKYGPLGRTRRTGEGEDVYLGKPAEFVLTDHANSKEGKEKAAEEAGKDKTIATLTTANTELQAVNKEKDTLIKEQQAEIERLSQNQGGGIDAETKDTIKDTNTKVTWIQDLLNRIFK